MSQNRMSGAAAVLTGLVQTYRYTLRGVIGANCRFAPSCSEYALEALACHGAVKGTALTTKRILRCNPWHEGGYDPVPHPSSSRSRTAL